MIELEEEGFETFKFTRRNADGVLEVIGKPFTIDVDGASMAFKAAADECGGDDEALVPLVAQYVESKGGPKVGEISVRDLLRFMMAVTSSSAEFKKKVDAHVERLGVGDTASTS